MKRRREITTEEALGRFSLFITAFCAIGMCLYAMGVHL